MKILVALFGLLAGLPASALTVPEHPDSTAAFAAEKKLEPISTWEMRVTAYTRDFAKRFNLP